MLVTYEYLELIGCGCFAQKIPGNEGNQVVDTEINEGYLGKGAV